MPSFALRHLLALAALTLLTAVLPPATHAAIVLGQARLGNVFLTTETVQIPLTCLGDEVSWVVTDFFGTTVKQNRTLPQNGAATITPNVGRPGYFELTMTEKKAGLVLSKKKTTFAVLTPFETTATASPFGAQTHFAQYLSTEPIELLRRAGIRHIRDEYYWRTVEATKGVFKHPQPYRDYMRQAAGAGIRPFLVFGFGNPLYETSYGEYTFPYTDAGRQGYANYVLNLLKTYGSQIREFEVWNETNAGTFVDGPATSNKAYYYARLLAKVHGVVKPARPDVKIVAGSTVPVAHGFLQKLFLQGAMRHIDAVSIHPYRGFAPGVEIDLAELRQLIRSYNNGHEKPIWATEYSLRIDTAEQQYEGATYLAQIVPLMLSQKLARMYYYLTSDDTVFPMRGLVSMRTDPKGKYTPHPTYVVYANVIRQLTGATYRSRHSSTSSSTYALRFDRGGQPLHVIWAMHPVTLRLYTSSTLTVTDMMGVARTYTPTNGVVHLQGSKYVKYVRGAIDSISESDNALFADSASGFSKTQGKNGWYYGTAGGTSYSPANFQPMTWKIWRDDNYRWVGANPDNFVTAHQLHPTGSYTIRRWVSNKTGTAKAFGEARRPAATGNGVYLALFVNGTKWYSRYIAPTQGITYSVSNIPIKPGTIIDFVVSNAGDSYNDATQFTASVLKQ
ncbi:MAG TPA: glycosyl hydrolase [Opitutaceae bacterium]